MSYLNHEYRLEGSQSVLEKVIQTMNEYFDDEYDDSMAGGGHEFCENSDGSFSWAFNCRSLLMELDDSLAELTRRNDAKIWVYHEEDNGTYIGSNVYFMGKGHQRQAGLWNADVGYEPAMAAIELEKSANVNVALVLLKILEDACDRPGRLPVVLAEMLLGALDRHPILAADESIWERLMKLQSPIASSYINREEADGDFRKELQRANGLFAKLEANKLKDGLTPPTGQACLPKAVRL